MKTDERKILKNVLIFDCETTGLPAKGAKWDIDFAEFPNVVQLAWAVNEKERSFIIKPEGWDIPEASTEVHGITQERAMKKTIKFVGALYPNGRPGKYPRLEELYNKCFPGETFPAHDALEDVRACRRCIPVLVENGIIELKPKEYPVEQLRISMEPAKTKKVKRVIEFNDPDPVLTPVVDPESNVRKMLDENDF